MPLFQRYLPFWAANLVERLWVFLLPLLAVLLPVVRLVLLCTSGASVAAFVVGTLSSTASSSTSTRAVRSPLMRSATWWFSSTI